MRGISMDKIDKILQHIIEIKTSQARMEQCIKKNTEDLEGVIQNRNRIKYLEEMENKRQGAFKLLTIIFASVGTIVGICFTFIKGLL